MNERELAEHLEGRADLEEVNSGEVQTPVEEPVTETPPEAETVSEQEQAQPDPVQQLLAKYGGDTDAALRAAAEAQSLIGRQGQELGEIRQTLQQLTQQFQPDPEPQFVPVDDGLVSWAQDIGSSPNFHEGADWALQHQPAIYDAIMEQAYAVDPRAAARYEMAKGLQSQQQALLQQLQPVLQPVVERKLSDEFGAAWIRVKSQTPDLDQYTPQLLQAAQENPELLTILQSGTPDAKERVINALYHMAKGRNAAPLQGVAQQAAEDAVIGAAALRTLAAVGTTTNSAPSAPVGDTGPLADWRAAFREEAGLPAPEAA